MKERSEGLRVEEVKKKKKGEEWIEGRGVCGGVDTGCTRPVEEALTHSGCMRGDCMTSMGYLLSSHTDRYT